MNHEQMLGLTADIVVAHVSNNTVSIGDVAELIGSVYGALNGIGMPSAPSIPDIIPAVSAKKSIANPDVIISMIDGKPYRMLKRHIALHGYTPESYRETFGLPKDYPMTAPAYSLKRRQLAISNGLGRKPKGN